MAPTPATAPSTRLSSSPGFWGPVRDGAAAKRRDGRPLRLLAFLGVGLVITLALVGADRWFVSPGPRSCSRATPD
jgi:hypothetical protein